MCPIYDSETLFSEAAWSTALIQPTKLNRWLPRQRWPGNRWVLPGGGRCIQPHSERKYTRDSKMAATHQPSRDHIDEEAGFPPFNVFLTGEGPVLDP